MSELVDVKAGVACKDLSCTHFLESELAWLNIPRPETCFVNVTRVNQSVNHPAKCFQRNPKDRFAKSVITKDGTDSKATIYPNHRKL